jgi:very-short-patch-repair endonuclease
MEVSIDRRIAALAARQRGYVTRPQVMKFGLTEKAIRHRVRISRLIPIYAGVYAVGHLPTLPPDRAFGALLACGSGAVLSHGSAATVWGIFKRWELPFEVTTPSTRRRPGIAVHRAVLTRQDIRTQLGLRVTSPARTLLDVAPRMTDKALTRAVNDLRRPGYLRLHHLAELLDRFPRSPASGRLRPFLDDPTGPTRSEFEDAFFAFSKRFGFPKSQVNARVCGFEVDVLFAEERVIVELDGWSFHNTRRSFESDRERDAELLARGFVTIRITWEQLVHDPERVAERLWAILRTRRAA